MTPMLSTHPHVREWCAIHEAIGVVQASVRDADWRADLVERLKEAAVVIEGAGGSYRRKENEG